MDKILEPRISSPAPFPFLSSCPLSLLCVPAPPPPPFLAAWPSLCLESPEAPNFNQAFRHPTLRGPQRDEGRNEGARGREWKCGTRGKARRSEWKGGHRKYGTHRTVSTIRKLKVLNHTAHGKTMETLSGP